MKRTGLMNILKYEIPQEYQNGNDVLVCHYCTWKLGFPAVILFVLGLFSGTGLTVSCLTGDNMYVPERLSLLILSIGTGVFCAAMGWLAVKYMKNWTVIFHENGIWYRNLTGKIYNYTDAEIKWYTITNGPKHYCITLGTASKRMWINRYSPNYRQAKELVQQKYQEWERYAEKIDIKKNEINYSVKLTAIGNDEVAVIKTYRDMTGLGVKEARDRVVAVPCILLETSSPEEAELYKTTLEECGATVNILESTTGTSL